jgi:hypothetical protein
MLKALLLALALLPLHPDHGSLPRREYRVNDKGEFNLLDDTMARDTLLKRGRYVVTHRVEDGEHWFTFSEVVKEPGGLSKPIDVRANIVAMRETFGRFVIYADPPPESDKDAGSAPEHHAHRLARIRVPGENVEHTF